MNFYIDEPLSDEGVKWKRRKDGNRFRREIGYWLHFGVNYVGSEMLKVRTMIGKIIMIRYCLPIRDILIWICFGDKKHPQ